MSAARYGPIDGRDREDNMSFTNRPRKTNSSEQDGTIRRFVHTPMEIEHYGIEAAIQKDGKIRLSKAAGENELGETEYDEIEIPASLVFKLKDLLNATRRVEYVSINDGEKATDELDKS